MFAVNPELSSGAWRCYWIILDYIKKEKVVIIIIIIIITQ